MLSLDWTSGGEIRPCSSSLRAASLSGEKTGAGGRRSLYFFSEEKGRPDEILLIAFNFSWENVIVTLHCKFYV